MPESAGAEEKDLLVAFELWAMAHEASNEARMVEAVQLAERAKKRLGKAAKAARKQDDATRIAQLRLELAEQFPASDEEVEARRTDYKRELAAAGNVTGGEESK